MLKKHKLFVRAPLSQKILSKLEENFNEVIYDPWNKTGERFYEDKMLEKLQEVQPDILITELDRITEKVLSGYDKLKVIGDCRATPANIDIEACNRHNIPVLCTPARNAQAVAEMVAGLIVAYYRNLIPSVKWVKDGKWTTGTTPYYTWMGNEIYGKEVGFVGFGAVGRGAAKILSAFGCKISYYDPYVDIKEYTKTGVDDIFKNSDIVSIHLPVTDDTRNMINKHHFDLMKKSAVFVNTARSAVVDEKSLIDALEHKNIRGAILDVLPTEPPNEEVLKIAKYDNVLLTPHICGATYEVIDHQSEIIFQRLMEFLEGDAPNSVVYNKDGIR